MPRMFSYTECFDTAFRIIIIQWKLRILQEASEMLFLIDSVIYCLFQFGTAIGFHLLDFQPRKISIYKRQYRLLSVIQSRFSRWVFIFIIKMIQGIDPFFRLSCYCLCQCKYRSLCCRSYNLYKLSSGMRPAAGNSYCITVFHQCVVWLVTIRDQCPFVSGQIVLQDSPVPSTQVFIQKERMCSVSTR